MEKFYIENINNECRLQDDDGKVFFILGFKFNKYYTATIYEFESISDDLKSWCIKNKDETGSFSYNSIIRPMLIKDKRDQTLSILLSI